MNNEYGRVIGKWVFKGPSMHKPNNLKDEFDVLSSYVDGTYNQCGTDVSGCYYKIFKEHWSFTKYASVKINDLVEYFHEDEQEWFEAKVIAFHEGRPILQETDTGFICSDLNVEYRKVQTVVKPSSGLLCEMNFYDRSGDNWQTVKVLYVGKQIMLYEKGGEEYSCSVKEEIRSIP